MIYRIYGQSDTTIYEPNARTKQNAGGDEILEISKFYDSETNTIWGGNSRILTQFDITEVSNSIVDGTISGSTKYYLNLTSIEEKEVPASYTLEVYPISQSWDAGVGMYNHSPIDVNGCSWEYRTLTEKWGTDSVTVFNGSTKTNVPTEGIVFYEGFTNNSSGSVYITDSVNGVDGSIPFKFIENDKLIVSASQYGGTTLVFPSELDANSTYGFQYQMDPGGFSDVQFRLQDPNGVIKTDGDFGNYENLTITSATTGSFELKTTIAGQYNLRFTFFDATGTPSTTPSASFDEVYVWAKGANIVSWETFSQNKGKFKLANVVNNINGELPTLHISESKLNVYSNNIGGGDVTYDTYLQDDLEYTITTSVTPGNYPDVGFTIYDTAGIKMRSGVTGLVSEFTSSALQNISFTPLKSGNYTFAYTFFDTGSLGASGSIDNFKIQYSGSLPAPHTSEASWYKNNGGATWFTSSLSNTSASQTFNTQHADLKVDVTDYITDILNGTRHNNGFIIKRTDSEEGSATNYGTSKFFSNNTNTIYVPTLEVRWDDSTFNTGALQALTSIDTVIYPKNLLAEYKEKSKARIRIVGRERFPQRTFSTTSLLTDIKYLPSTTYYQIRDVETNLVLVPFDTSHTKVSCDDSGNYFDFWFNTLQPERFYQFEFRVDTNNVQQYFNGYVFKVVR